jgi:two-component system response regulator NreC
LHNDRKKKLEIEEGETFVKVYSAQESCEGLSPIDDFPYRITRPLLPAGRHDQSSVLAVSIITESQLLYEALTFLLPTYVAITFLHSYSSELCSLADAPNPPGHLVLLDTTIDHKRGINWTKTWRAQAPAASVIAIEMVDDYDTILSYIEVGASAYLLKGASAGQVAAMLTEVHSGRTTCAPELLVQIFRRLEDNKLHNDHSYVYSPLTLREQEVLQRIEQGYSNREIADELVITVYTVKHHVHNILEKLRLHRRCDAAKFARKQGWFD